MRVKSKLSYEKRKQRVGFYFILPFVIGSIVFFLRPLVESIILSLSNIKVTPQGSSYIFVGVKHYVDALNKDPEFVRKMVESFRSLIYIVPIILLLSLFLAIILNQKFVGRIFVRGLFFLPVIIANGVVLSILNGDVYANTMVASNASSQMFQSEFLQNFMLETGFQQSFVNTFVSLIDNIFNLLWKSGVQILIFLSGLQMISPSMYEAAEMEGATWWETFWKITFPIISPVTLLNLIYTIVDVFTDYSNEVMSHINRIATSGGLELELSTAMSWIYFSVIGVVLVVAYVLINRKVFYET